MSITIRTASGLLIQAPSTTTAERQNKIQQLKWEEWTCAGVARSGSLEGLKWLRSCIPPCPWDEWTCSGMAEVGSLEGLKWLRSCTPPCPWDTQTCVAAAKNGHLHILQWLHSEGHLNDLPITFQGLGMHLISFSTACLFATRKCQWHCLKFLLNTPRNGSHPSSDELNGWIRARKRIMVSKTKDRVGYYQARQWLRAHRHLVFSIVIKRWLKTVEAVSKDVLYAALGADVLSLVHGYC